MKPLESLEKRRWSTSAKGVAAPHESTGAWDGRLAVVANPGAFIRLVPKNEQRRSDFRHDLKPLGNSAKLSKGDAKRRGCH